MKPSPILVSHYGWFLFCPVYWSEEEDSAVPRHHGLWWLFDLALEIQQARNWILSLFGYEGGFPFSLRQLQQPKVITR